MLHSSASQTQQAPSGSHRITQGTTLPPTLRAPRRTTLALLCLCCERSHRRAAQPRDQLPPISALMERAYRDRGCKETALHRGSGRNVSCWPRPTVATALPTRQQSGEVRKPRPLTVKRSWKNFCDGPSYASSAFNAASMNALSAGFTPRPAACPQIEGIGRNSAFGICATSS
jgi:hypothetical protein